MNESKVRSGVTSRARRAAPPGSLPAGSENDLGQFRAAVFLLNCIIKKFIKEGQGFAQRVQEGKEKACFVHILWIV